MNCCSHFSFDLETPVKENNPFPALTGYFISRKHACYFSNYLGFPVGFMINEQRHLLVEDKNVYLLREATIRTWLYMNPKLMLNVLISGSKEPTLEFKSKNQTMYTYMNIDKFTLV